jgi:hypothetical protein
MNSASAHELGYASAAIVSALLDSLIVKQVISKGDAKIVLDDAMAALGTLGNNQSALGAQRVVSEVRSRLVKYGVS